MLAMVFVFTMTGLDAILAHAFDYSYQAPETRQNNLEVNRDSMMTGGSVESSAPDAFLDIQAGPQTVSDPGAEISTTSLNVLKSEYGNLLDTVSLTTLAERSTSSFSLDAMVNNMLSETESPEGTSQPTSAEETDVAPAMDPAAMVDVVDASQGPVSLSLEMKPNVASLTTEDTGIDTLPIPAAATESSETEVSSNVNTAAVPVNETETVETVQPVTTDQPMMENNAVAVVDNNQNQTMVVDDSGQNNQDQTTVPDVESNNQTVAPQDQNNQTNEQPANEPTVMERFVAMVTGNNLKNETVDVEQTGQPDTATTVDAAVVVTDKPQGNENTVTNQPETVQVQDSNLPDINQTIQVDTTQVNTTDQTETTTPLFSQNLDNGEGNVQPSTNQAAEGNESGFLSMFTMVVKDEGDESGSAPENGEDTEETEVTELETGNESEPSTDTEMLLTAENEGSEPDAPTVNDVTAIDDSQSAVALSEQNVDVPLDVSQPAVETGTGQSESEIVALEEGEEGVEGDMKPEGKEEETEPGSGESAETADATTNVNTANEPDAVDTDIAVPEVDVAVTAEGLEMEIALAEGPETPQVDALYQPETPETETPNVETPEVSPTLDVDAATVPQPEIRSVSEVNQAAETAPVHNSNLEMDANVETGMVGPSTNLTADKTTTSTLDPETNQDTQIQASTVINNTNTFSTENPLVSTNPLMASTVPLVGDGSQFAVSNPVVRMVSTLGQNVAQGSLLLFGSQNPNTVSQSFVAAPQVAKVSTDMPPQIGLTQTAPLQSIDINMQSTMSFNPAVNGSAPQTDTGPPMNIVSFVKVASAAVRGQDFQIPPRPNVAIVVGTTPALPNYFGSDDAFAAEAEALSTHHTHRDPPEHGSGGGSCASFMASPIGKVFMFVVTIVLTVITVGTAAPILLAIIIMIEAIVAFVPLPEGLAIVLMIFTAVLGGWAQGIGQLAGTAVSVAGQAMVSAAQTAAQVSVAAMSAIFKTLGSTIVLKAIAKMVVAKAIMLAMAHYFPDASPLLFAAVSLGAGMIGSGVAAMFDADSFGDVFKQFAKGFMAELKAAIGMTASGFDLTAMVNSNTFKSLMAVGLEIVATKIMESAGYTEQYSAMIGGLIGGAVAGAVNYMTDPGVASTAKFMSLVVLPATANGLSTFYALYAAPMLEDQGFSKVQTRHFGENLGAIVRQFVAIPTNTTATGASTAKSVFKSDALPINSFFKNLKQMWTNITTPTPVDNMAASPESGSPPATTGQTPPVTDQPSLLFVPQYQGSVGQRLLLNMPTSGYMPQPMSMSSMFMPSETMVSAASVSGGFGAGGKGGVGIGTLGVGAGTLGMTGLGMTGTTPSYLAGSTMQMGSSVIMVGGTGTNYTQGPLIPTTADNFANRSLSQQSDLSPTTAPTGVNMPESAPNTAGIPSTGHESMESMTSTTTKVDSEVTVSPKSSPDSSSMPAPQDTKPKETSQPRSETAKTETSKQTNTQTSHMNNTMDAADNNSSVTAPQQQPQQDASTKPQEGLDNRTSVNNDAGTRMESSDAPRNEVKLQNNDVKIADLDGVQRMDGDVPKPEGDAISTGSNASGGDGGGANTANTTEMQNKNVQKNSENNNRLLESGGSDFVSAGAANANGTEKVSAVANSGATTQPSGVQQLAKQLEAGGSLQSGSNYSYSQGQNADGQNVTKVFNNTGQLIGAQTTRSDGTQVTKTFDYQTPASLQTSTAPGSADAGKTAATQPTEVKTTTYENGAVTQEQTFKVEDGKMTPIADKPVTRGLTAETDKAGQTKGEAAKAERRNDDIAVSTDASGGNTSGTPGDGSAKTTASGDGADGAKVTADGSDPVASGETAKASAPKVGEGISTNIGTDANPIEVSFKFDGERTQIVEDAGGKQYQVALNSNNEFVKQGEYRMEGSFMKGKERVFVPNGSTQGQGDKGGVYEYESASGGSGTKVSDEFVAAYTDSKGEQHALTATLPVDAKSLPADVRKAMILAENAAKGVAVDAAGGELTLAETRSMGTEAVKTLQNHADSQLLGTQQRQDAMGSLAKAEMGMYANNPDPGALGSIANHVSQSNSPEMNLQLAALQADDGTTEQAVNSVKAAMSLADNTNMPADQKAAINMKAAEMLGSMDNAGQAFEIEQAMKGAQEFLSKIQPGNMDAKAAAMSLQYQALDDKIGGDMGKFGNLDLPEMSPEISKMTQNLSNEVQSAASGVSNGQSKDVPSMNGSVSKDEKGNITFTQKNDDGSLVSMEFGSNENGTLSPQKVTVADSNNVPQEIFTSTPQGMKMTEQNTQLEVNLGQGDQGQTAFVQKLLAPNRTADIFGEAVINGAKHTLIIHPDNTATATLIKPDATAGTTKYFDPVESGDVSFNAAKNEGTMTIDGNRQVVKGAVLQTNQDLLAAGFKPETSQHLLGKTAFIFQMPDNTTLTVVGSPAEIAAKQYYVSGTTQFTDGGKTESIGYIAKYDGRLQEVHLSDKDQTVVQYTSKDLSDFVVDKTTDGGNRTARATYENNSLTGYKISYKQMGITLAYDKNGKITPESFAMLRATNGDGYSLRMTDSGFTIMNNATEVELFFSHEGRALQKSNPGEAGGSGTQQVVEFDFKETMILNIAKIENGKLGSQEVRVENIYRKHILIQTSPQGTMTKSETVSSMMGEVTQPVADFEFASKGTSGEWKPTGYRDYQTVTTDKGETISLVVTKSADPGANWTGVENGKVYSEQANGTFKQTGTQQKMTITLDSGRKVTTTVSSRGMINPTPGTAEVDGGIYTQQPDGTFKQTGRVVYDNATVDGFNYRVRTTVSTLQTHSSQSFTKNGTTYTKTAEGYIATAEHKYVTTGNEINMASRSLLTEHALWRVTDSNGNVYSELEAKVADQYPNNQVGELVMIERAGRFENINGLYVQRMTNLRTSRVSGTDIYGNGYGIDEGGKLGKAGEFTMLTKVVDTVVVNGAVVTQTINLLDGKNAQITGSDMYGNTYGYDTAGKLGEKGAFVMITQAVGTEIIGGAIVTKTRNLLTNKVTGSDMYGNQHVLDVTGEYGAKNKIVQSMEFVKVEKAANGLSVTVTRSLLGNTKGIESGVDMYGSTYVRDATGEYGVQGSLVQSQQAMGVEIVNGIAVSVMKGLLGSSKGMVSGSDMYGNSYVRDATGEYGAKGSLMMSQAYVRTEVVKGKTVTVVRNMLGDNKGVLTGSDAFGNGYINGSGKMVMSKAFVGREVVDGKTVTVMRSLLGSGKGIETGSDAFGNSYVRDAAGEYNAQGKMVMSQAFVGREVVDGKTVTVMRGLLGSGKGIETGSDAFGNSYVRDAAGEYGAQSSMVMSQKFEGRTIVNGKTVTMMRSMLGSSKGVVTGSDMFGNSYVLDATGEYGAEGKMVMSQAFVGREVVDGKTVTVMRGLLGSSKGIVTGSDAFGNSYVSGSGGKMVMSQKFVGRAIVNGRTVTMMRGMLGNSKGIVTGSDAFGNSYVSGSGGKMVMSQKFVGRTIVNGKTVTVMRGMLGSSKGVETGSDAFGNAYIRGSNNKMVMSQAFVGREIVDGKTVTVMRSLLGSNKGVETGSDIFGNSYVRDATGEYNAKGEMVMSQAFVGREIVDGKTVTVMRGLLGSNKGVESGSDIFGNSYVRDAAGEYNAKGKMVMSQAFVGREVVDGKTVTVMRGLLGSSKGVESGSDAFGNTYTRDKAGEHNAKGEMVMSQAFVGREIVDGKTVTVMRGLLGSNKGVETGSDAFGNTYTRDKAGEHNAKGEMVMSQAFVGREIVDGKTVTVMRNLLGKDKGVETGSDAFGNTYTRDKTGEHNAKGELVMSQAFVGREIVDGKTVTVMRNLLGKDKGVETGSDAFGNTYTRDKAGEHNAKGELVMSQAFVGREIVGGKTVTVMRGLLGKDKGVETGSDIFGNMYVCGKRASGAAKANMLMSQKFLEYRVVDGKTVTMMEGTLGTGEGVVSGSDMFGNQYGMIESRNSKAEFGMTSKYLGTVIIDGKTVTKMEALLDLDQDGTVERGEKTITGSDVFGNQYGVDKEGEFGTKGAFTMTSKFMGNEEIGGVMVTKMINLLDEDATMTGSDVFGNQYGIDEKGVLGDKGTFRMISKYLGKEVVNGMTVTKMENLLEGNVTGTDMYGNQYAKNEHGSLVQISRTEVITVDGKDIKLTLSVEDDATMVRGLGEKPIKMGADIKVKVEGDKIILTDARGVKRTYTGDGREVTSLGRKFGNVWNKFASAISGAVNKYVDGVMKAYNEEGGFTLKYFGKSMGEFGKMLGRMTLATVVGILDGAGTALRAAVEVSLDYSGTGMLYKKMTGESLGALVIDKFMAGVETVFAPMDSFFQWAGEQLNALGDYFVKVSESYADMPYGDAASAIFGTLAVLAKATGDNLPIIIILSLNLIPVVGTMLSGIAAAVMIGKDALINGLGTMFETFFVEPFVRIAEGIHMMGDSSRPGSRIRHIVNGMSQVVGGAIGVIFAVMMVRAPFVQAKGAFSEAGLSKMKQHMKTEIAQGRGKQLLSKTVEQLAKDAGLKPKKGMSGGEIKVRDLNITSGKGQGATIGQMAARQGGGGGMAQFMKMVEAPGFRMSHLQMPKGAGTFAGHALTSAKLGKQLNNFRGRHSAGNYAKAAGTFISSFAKHQAQMITNAPKMIKLLAEGKTIIKGKSGGVKTVEISSVAPRFAAFFSPVGRFMGAIRVRMVSVRNSVMSRITGRQTSKSQVTGETGAASRTVQLEGTPAQKTVIKAEASLRVAEKLLSNAKAEGSGASARYTAGLEAKVTSLKADITAARELVIPELKAQRTAAEARTTDASLKTAERQAAAQESALLTEQINVESGKVEIAKLKSDVKALRAETTASDAKIAKLESRMESYQKAIEGLEARMQTRAQGGTHAAAMAELTGMKNKAETRMKTAGTAEQRSAAAAELKQIQAEMTLQKAKQRVLDLGAEIKSKTDVNEVAKMKLDTMEAKLEAQQEVVSGIESRQQNRQALAEQSTKLKSEAKKMAGQSETLKTEMEQAKTPGERAQLESQAKRLEIAQERNSNQQKQVDTQKKILDLDAQFENTTDAKRSNQLLDQKAEAMFEQAGLQNEAKEIENRIDKADMEQLEAKIQDLTQRTGDATQGQPARLSEVQMKELTKSFTEEGGKPVEGRRQLMKMLDAIQKGGSIDAKVMAMFQGPGAAMRLKAMAGNGMKSQAQKVFEQLCTEQKSRGNLSIEQQHSLAKDLGLKYDAELAAKAEGAYDVALAKESVFNMQESAARQSSMTAESIGDQHIKNLDAVETFHNNVAEAGKQNMDVVDARVEGLARSKAPAGEAVKNLMKTAEGRATVREMSRRMTVDQLRKLLSSSDPMQVIRNFKISQTSQAAGEIMGRQAKVELRQAESRAKTAEAKVAQAGKQGGDILQKAEMALEQANAELQTAKQNAKIANSAEVTSARSAMTKTRNQAGELRRQIKKPAENLQKAEAEATTAKSGLRAAEHGVEAAKTSGKGVQAAEASLKQARAKMSEAQTSLAKAKADYMEIAAKYNEANLAQNRAEAKVEAEIAKQKPTAIEAAQAKSAEMVKNAEARSAELTEQRVEAAGKDADTMIKKAESGIENAKARVTEAETALKNAQGKKAEILSKVELKKAQETLRAAENHLKTVSEQKTGMIESARKTGQETAAKMKEQAVKQGEQLVKEAQTQVKKSSTLADQPGNQKGLIKRSHQISEAVKARDLLKAKLNRASDQTVRETLKADIVKAESRIDNLRELALEKPAAGNALSEAYMKTKLALKRRFAKKDSAILKFDVAAAVARILEPQKAADLKARLNRLNELQAEIEKSAETTKKTSKRQAAKREKMISERQGILEGLHNDGFTQVMLESLGLKNITTSKPAVLEQIGFKMGEALTKLRSKGRIGELQSELTKAFDAKETAKFDALMKEYKAEVAKLMPEMEAMIERILPKEMNSQARMIFKELVKQFQADASYRFFTLDQPMLSFLFRQAELHYLNMELHVKNPAMKTVIGEALQLAMGGGKSSSPITLKVAMELFKANHPGMKVPAMLYMTVNPSLVKQILGEYAFKQMAKEGMLIELTKETSADVIKNGFQEGKMYVSDCETLKHVVLEMRSAGKTDAQIAKLLQKKLGTAAWDELHAAFHVTDTIIGASGIAPYLSGAVKAQLGDVAIKHVEMYGNVREWFINKVTKDGVVQKNKVFEVFENVENGFGKQARNQIQFTAEALKEIRSATGLDYAKSGDRIILDKMAKVLSTKNGREWTGELKKGRAHYGTAEGGVGKPNTIFGDQLQAAFTNIEIFFQSKGEGMTGHRAAMREIKSSSFRARNSQFIESVVEALVHTTTERVTMTEAMNLLGAQNIVGFSGTFEGITGTLSTWGKRLVRVNNEPVVDLYDVVKQEGYFQVKVGQDVITLRMGSDGKVKMELSREGYNDRTAVVREAIKLMETKIEGETIHQQVFTHNDNPALMGTLAEIKKALHEGTFSKQKYKTQTVEINAKSIERYISDHNIKVERGEGNVLTSASAEKVIRRMMKHPGGDVVQLIQIDGMAPELWTVAMGELESMIKAEGGWKQKRMIMAPKVGEGLNTLSTKGHMQKMRAAIHQMDMRPIDVYRQAMKRVNVLDNNTGAHKRARGISGLSLDLNEINNITRGEIGEFRILFDKIQAAMESKGNQNKVLSVDLQAKEVNGKRVPLSSTDAHFDLFKQFSDLLVGEGRVKGETTGIAKRILNEVDVQKTQASRKTQAGIQTEETVSVKVAKGSPEYMAELAKTVESNLPKLLRKYQGITDIAARRSGTPATALSRVLTLPNYNASRLQTNTGWQRIPVIKQLAGYFEARTSAIQASGAQIQLVTEYAKTWQSDAWQQKNSETVAKYQGQYGEQWVDAKMTEKFGETWKLYQTMGESNNIVSQIRVLNRGNSLMKRSYMNAVENIARVSMEIPELQANPHHSTMSYQGLTMDLFGANNYINQQLNRVRYFNQFTTIKVSASLQKLIESRNNIPVTPGELEVAARETLAMQSWAKRTVKGMTQGWSNMLRHMQQARFILPLFNVKDRYLVPSRTSTLLIGAAAFALLGFTGLPTLGLASGLLLMPLAQPLFNQATRFIPGKAQEIVQAMSGRWTSLGSRLFSTVITAALIGVLLGGPVGMVCAISATTGTIVEQGLIVRVEKESRVTINHQKPEVAGAVESTRSAENQIQAGRSLVDTWKQQMGGKEADGQTAVNTLVSLLKESRFGNIDLNVHQQARHYGYMHLLAAVFSLVPNALDSVHAVDLGSDTVAESENIVNQAGSRIRVGRDSIRFLDQKFSNILLTQTIMAISSMFSDAEYNALESKLQQSPHFREFGQFAVVEFIKQYILDGEALKEVVGQAEMTGLRWAGISRVQDGQALQINLYEYLKSKFEGREFTNDDLVELNQAMGELENTALPLMQKLSAQIEDRTLARDDRVYLESSFEAQFGISYASYTKMMNPSLMQRVLTRQIGQDILVGTEPRSAIKQYGRTLFGFGAALALAGGIVVGVMMSAVIPAIVGAVIAVVGLAIGMQGLLSWVMADQIAFNVNPSNAVLEGMRNAEFGFANQAQQEQVHSLGLDTRQLLENVQFTSAVEGLKIKGTEQMLSENNRTRAIRMVLSHLVRVMESKLDREMKIQLARETTQVLGFLKFDIDMHVKQYESQLAMTMTPTVEPQALKHDYKIGRLIRRLKSLGVGININVAPGKQPKLKITGSAA